MMIMTTLWEFHREKMTLTVLILHLCTQNLQRKCEEKRVCPKITGTFFFLGGGAQSKEFKYIGVCIGVPYSGKLPSG